MRWSIKAALGAGSLVLLGSSLLFSQTLKWPMDNQNSQHRIGGTLGEYRSTGSPHFHDGVDVSTSASQPSSTVKAILAGTVTNSGSGAGPNDNFVTVQSGQVTLIYMHVVPSFSTTTVVIGDTLGTIFTGSGWSPHVHLEQIKGAYDENVLLTPNGGFVGFSDNSAPVIDEVKLYDPNSRTEIVVSSPISTASIDIRTKAHGVQTVGSSNVGLFELGYKLVNTDTGATAITVYPKQAYSRIPTSIINNPEVAYDTTTSNNSIYYYFVNNGLTQDTPLSLTPFASGNYEICALVKDAKDPHLVTSCTPFTLDHGSPTMSLRKTDGTPITTGATNETSIVVTATDTFSLAKLIVDGTGGSTKTVSGTTATETFTGLSDGEYTAHAVDLAGNQTSVAFMVGSKHFLDERWA